MLIESAIEQDKQQRLDKINETLSKITDEKQREIIKEDLMSLHNSTEYIVLDENKKTVMSDCEHIYKIDEHLEGRVHRICIKCGLGKYLVS